MTFTQCDNVYIEPDARVNNSGGYGVSFHHASKYLVVLKYSTSSPQRLFLLATIDSHSMPA